MINQDEETQIPPLQTLFKHQMNSRKTATPGRETLNILIDEMFRLLEKRGFKRAWPFPEKYNPVENYPHNQTDYALAGMAITHANAAIQAIEMAQTDLAVIEAIRAERFRVRLYRMTNGGKETQRQPKFKHARLARTPPEQMIQHKNNDSDLLKRREKIISDLQQKEVWRGYFPRYLIAIERGVPIDEVSSEEVSNVREYLRLNGLDGSS